MTDPAGVPKLVWQAAHQYAAKRRARSNSREGQDSREEQNFTITARDKKKDTTYAFFGVGDKIYHVDSFSLQAKNEIFEIGNFAFVDKMDVWQTANLYINMMQGKGKLKNEHTFTFEYCEKDVCYKIGFIWAKGKTYQLHSTLGDGGVGIVYLLQDQDGRHKKAKIMFDHWIEDHPFSDTLAILRKLNEDV